MKNFDPGPGSDVGELLGEVARLDVELAYQIVEMPWLTDGVGLDDEIALEVLSYSAIEAGGDDRGCGPWADRKRVVACSRVYVPGEIRWGGFDELVADSFGGPWDLGDCEELNWLTDGITEAEDIGLFEIAERAKELPELADLLWDCHGLRMVYRIKRCLRYQYCWNWVKWTGFGGSGYLVFLGYRTGLKTRI